MRLGRSLGVVAVSCGLAFAAAAPGWATGTVETGWWTRNPAAEAPPKGVQVAMAPDGAVSQAAVRVDLGRGVTSARLTMKEEGGFGQDVAAIHVCRAGEGWTAEHGGDLGNAPKAQCGISPLSAERGNGSWTADVTDLVAGTAGRVTLMLTPSAGTAPVGAWEVRLERPTFDAVEASAPAPAPEPPPAPTPQAAEPVAVAGASEAATSSPSSPVADYAPSAPPVAAAVPTTATAAADPAGAGGLEIAQAFSGAEDDGGGGRPWGKAFMYVVFSALVGTGAGAARRRFTH